VEQEAEEPAQTPEEPERFVPKGERLAPNGLYTVQRGDNPYMVARKLGVSFTDLMTANSISNPADVSIGMRLKVPSNKLASN
jgi:LysM repeat protein